MPRAAPHGIFRCLWKVDTQMTDPPPTRVTQILVDLGKGDPHAAAKLLPLVYEELRTLAHGPCPRTMCLRTRSPVGEEGEEVGCADGEVAVDVGRTRVTGTPSHE